MTKKGVPIVMINKPKNKVWNRPTLKNLAETTSLRFSPTAWAKLLYLRDYGETEVGGFGIAASDDLLWIQDIQLVQQVGSWANVAFDDRSVADYFDRQVDLGRRPEEFARIWVHTHPGECPLPSLTDERTFSRVFGNSDWAVMFILAREGLSYARLRFHVGPGAELEIPVHVGWEQPFGGCDPEAWEREYLEHVKSPEPLYNPVQNPESRIEFPREEEPPDNWLDPWFEYSVDEEPLKGLV